ncbi:histone H1E isoform X2 [Setaria italica]|uniref:histone H1E isoform X2 n=1 Tax=Setaria italica TaxID=4555 RepID=UPI000BE4E030|nr:histone H1E isoform X2 [Setaria italica]
MGTPVAASLPSQRRQSHKAVFLCSASSRTERPLSRALPMASGAAAAPAVQTVVLRVSIHCHGCKKKVRKVLRSIEGVQSVTVDAAQHKVTVTGTVDASTLVQRLHKSGKKGVPWDCHPPANKTEAAPAPAPAPEALPPPAAKPAGDAGKDAAAAAAADKKPEEAVKEPKAESPEKKKPEQEGAGAEKKPEAESKAEKKVEAKKEGGDDEAAEPKAKGAEPAKEEAKEAVAAATKDEDEAKKVKDEKPKDAGKAEPAAVTERSLSSPPPPAPKHAYYEEEYRRPYYPTPQPVLSYHAAQPSASVSYFAPQPHAAAYSMQQPQPQAAYSTHQPPQQQMRQWSPSYLYLPYPHAAPEPYHHQDYYSPPGMHASPPPMQDSYRIFDDENPNSCSVM